MKTLIENYFAKYKPKSYEVEMRGFMNDVFKQMPEGKHYRVDESTTPTMKNFYADVATYTICLELKVFRERLEHIQKNSPKRTDLIESYSGTILTLETLIDFVRNVKNDINEFVVSRQRNHDMEIKILMQEREIEELKKKNKELIDLI